MRRAVILLAATTVLVLLAAAPVFAAGWTPVETVQTESGAPSGNAGAPVTAVNSNGAQAIAWEEQTCGFEGCTCTGAKATSRLPGGDWAPAATIGCKPRVVIGPGGQVFAFWTAQTGANAFALYAASANAGQSFGTPVVVDTGTTSYLQIAAAVDVNGVPTVAWMRFVAAYNLYAQTRKSDGTWPTTAPETVQQQVTQDPSATALSMAIAPNRDAIVAWNNRNTALANSDKITASFRPAGATGIWPEAQDLVFSATAARGAKVVFDAQSRPTVIGAYTKSGVNRLDSMTRVVTNGLSSWPKRLVTGSNDSTGLPVGDIAVDSLGNAQVAYEHTNGSGFNIRAARYAAGDTAWTNDGDLLTSRGANPIGPPSVAIDGTDTATIAFTVDGTTRVFRRASGSGTYSAFSPPPGSVSPTLVTDAEGHTIATWTIGGVTYTSVYDPVAPTIDALSVPESGEPGQALSFVINASDAWSPATYSVDFGDGTPPATGRAIAGPSGVAARVTTGGTVSHSYASTGSYVATISVTDGVGNTTTTTRTVNVAPPAGPAAITPVGQVLPPSGLSAPVLGESINVFVVKAPVRVKLPGTRTFRSLTKPEKLPNGTVIDTRRGRVLVVIADGAGDTDQAEFYEGVFEVNQPKALKGLANIFLDGGGFKGCPRAPKNPHAQVSAKKSPHRSVRHLWGKGSGKFRTVGRFSSATVRGTTWLTDDRCDGTLVRVRQGKVAVRDFIRRKTVLVRATKSYFARARR